MSTVSRAIVRLFERERFYAELVSQMRRIEDRKYPAVAGVCVKNTVELVINPEMFDKLKVSAEEKIDEQVGILIHECEHVLRGHIPRARELHPEIYNNSKDLAENIINDAKHKAMNIAMDLANNSGIKDVPEWGCFPEKFDLPRNETFEFYHEALKDSDKLENLQEWDEHSIWAESDKDKEVLKEKIRQAVNKAAQKTRAAGLMTADMELLVENFNSGNTVSWREKLKNFVARAWSVVVEDTRKKRNRRYGVMYPGVKKIEQLHVGVPIDTSGSMSDEALVQALREVANIAKFAKVTVVEVDAEIKDSYVFDPKKKYRVKGRGGTAYQPAFDYFNAMTGENAIDAMIYIGDMDCADTPEKPKYPVLWAVVGNQKPPVDWGTRIQVTV